MNTFLNKVQQLGIAQHIDFFENLDGSVALQTSGFAISGKEKLNLINVCA